MAGVAILGSAAIGAASKAYGASKASEAQREAAQQAAATQRKMYKQSRQDLEPYLGLGKKYSEELDQRMDFLTSPIDVTKELQDPTTTAAKAYDFTKTQGLKAVQNAAAKRGLGVSGAALKGASSFVTGLADNTYRNLFDMENINRGNAYTRLKNVVDTGADAAKSLASVGTQAATGIAGAQIGAGNAQAAGYNAIAGAVGDFASDVGGYAAYKGLYGGGKNAVDLMPTDV